jgi:uroporphyrinogen-III synthase
MHVLVTRPEPEAAACKAQLEALGHEVSVEPMLRIELLPIAAAALAGAAGIIVTSRNALRALGASPALAPALGLPILTVGHGTAEFARKLNFERVLAGEGSAAELVPMIAAAADSIRGPLIHLAGEMVAFDLETPLAAHGVELRKIVAYRAVAAKSLSDQTKALLANGAIDAAILMSERTAAIFSRLVADAGLRENARGIVFLCLSSAVAVSLREVDPGRVEVAERPNSEAMLAAVTRVATLSSGV